MTAYVALLRAVNVGGRKLAMADLKAIAEELGFESVGTFIASGNLLFASSKSEAEVGRLLEDRLRKHIGAEVPVMVRTASEMAAVAEANPFSGEPPSKVAAIFLEKAPPRTASRRRAGLPTNSWRSGGARFMCTIRAEWADPRCGSRRRLPERPAI